jgi:hypothetical protein
MKNPTGESADPIGEAQDSADRQAAIRFISRASRTDLIELIPHMAALTKRVGSEYWWIAPEVYAAFERQGLHLTQDSYYSPLPNIGEAEEWYKRRGDTPIRAAEALCDAPRFLEVWNEAVAFAAELKYVPRQASKGYCWDNVFFPNLDAVIYYGLIRSRRPARIIEIGSGFSTHVAAMALRKNGAGELHVIEPYPTSTLMELTGDCASFHKQKVQDVAPDVIAVLGPGDFLFVDSSHVSKIGSDLNWIMFEIVPRLPADLFIHFHDIFLPYEYPVNWIVGRNWSWNEQYLLLAYLMSNPDRVPLVGNQSLLRHCGEFIAGQLASFDIGPLSGASFWVR